MDFKTFLLIIIGSALANNVVLEQFFGVTPALGAKGSAKALAKYGLAVAAVTLVAALCTACISIGVYSTFVAALWVLIAASVIGHFFTDKYLLIALNGVVFGTCANAAGQRPCRSLGFRAGRRAWLHRCPAALCRGRDKDR